MNEAIQQAAPMLSKEQFSAELKYRAAINVAKSMLDKGLIGGLRYNCDRSNKSSKIKGLRGLVL